jgi:hypothetical protein
MPTPVLPIRQSLLTQETCPTGEGSDSQTPSERLFDARKVGFETGRTIDESSDGGAISRRFPEIFLADRPGSIVCNLVTGFILEQHTFGRCGPAYPNPGEAQLRGQPTVEIGNASNRYQRSPPLNLKRFSAAEGGEICRIGIKASNTGPSLLNATFVTATERIKKVISLPLVDEDLAGFCPIRI